jgi:hypothetical protein
MVDKAKKASARRQPSVGVARVRSFARGLREVGIDVAAVVLQPDGAVRLVTGAGELPAADDAAFEAWRKAHGAES